MSDASTTDEATPRPWLLSEDDDFDVWRWITQDGFSVFWCTTTADAELILAAGNAYDPEREAKVRELVEASGAMIDVLRRIQDTLSRHVDPGGDLQDPMETVNAVLEIADHRDTLAKQRACLAALKAMEAAE